MRDTLRKVARQWSKLLSRMSKKVTRIGLYEFLDRELPQIAADEKVLTVGAGGKVTARLVSESRRRHFLLESIDIDPKREPDILGDICTHHFESDTYDTIIICEVLEHVRDAKSAVQNLHSALKPGGRILASLPFIFPMHEMPKDFMRFTRYGVLALFDEYSDVSARACGSYFDAIDVMWMRVLYSKSKGSLALASLVIPFVFFVKRPITLLLNTLIKTDTACVRYVVTATKSSEAKS